VFTNNWQEVFVALIFALHAGKVVTQIAAVKIILLRGMASVATPARRHAHLTVPNAPMPFTFLKIDGSGMAA
jgi:hypothetical protein